MSLRALSYEPPCPDADDTARVSVSVRDLRRLAAASAYLATLADNSRGTGEPGEPDPDDVRATDELTSVLSRLLRSVGYDPADAL